MFSPIYFHEKYLWDVMHPLPNLECVSLSEVTNEQKRKEKLGEMTPPPPLMKKLLRFLCNFIQLSSDLILISIKRKKTLVVTLVLTIRTSFQILFHKIYKSKNRK